jgi:hypothetical protein
MAVRARVIAHGLACVQACLRAYAPTPPNQQMVYSSGLP